MHLLDRPLTREDRERLSKAFEFALEHHGHMARKGTQIPYVSHLIQVAGLVQEHGGGIDETIAGLLHDSLKDCNDVDRDAIGKFGKAVVEIVMACTDTKEGDTSTEKGDWAERKRRYVKQLEGAGRPARLVAACDKLHNLRSLVSDLLADGPGTLERFNSTPRQQRWYYETVREVIGEGLPARLLHELDALLTELQEFNPEASPDP